MRSIRPRSKKRFPDGKAARVGVRIFPEGSEERNASINKIPISTVALCRYTEYDFGLGGAAEAALLTPDVIIRRSVFNIIISRHLRASSIHVKFIVGCRRGIRA